MWAWKKSQKAERPQALTAGARPYVLMDGEKFDIDKCDDMFAFQESRGFLYWHGDTLTLQGVSATRVFVGHKGSEGCGLKMFAAFLFGAAVF